MRRWDMSRVGQTAAMPAGPALDPTPVDQRVLGRWYTRGSPAVLARHGAARTYPIWLRSLTCVCTARNRNAVQHTAHRSALTAVREPRPRGPPEPRRRSRILVLLGAIAFPLIVAAVVYVVSDSIPATYESNAQLPGDDPEPAGPQRHRHRGGERPRDAVLPTRDGRPRDQRRRPAAPREPARPQETRSTGSTVNAQNLVAGHRDGRPRRRGRAPCRRGDHGAARLRGPHQRPAEPDLLQQRLRGPRARRDGDRAATRPSSRRPRRSSSARTSTSSWVRLLAQRQGVLSSLAENAAAGRPTLQGISQESSATKVRPRPGSTRSSAESSPRSSRPASPSCCCVGAVRTAPRRSPRPSVPGSRAAPACPEGPAPQGPPSFAGRRGRAGARMADVSSSLVHTCLRVRDPEASVRFYGALGFEPRGRLNFASAYNVYLGLPGRGRPARADGQRRPRGAATTSATATTTWPSPSTTWTRCWSGWRPSLGVQPEKAPYRPGGRDDLPRIAFVADPDGYRVELIDGGRFATPQDPPHPSTT